MTENGSKRAPDSVLENPAKRRPELGNIDLILKKERIDNEDFNIILLHASPEQRFDFITRQLSFYLSNDNLSNDYFYHTKFTEDSANIGVENVIDVKYILSAKRMTEIKATLDDIKKAISENLVPNLSFHDSDGTLYIKLNTPLPKYVGKKPLGKKKKLGETPETYHVAGPLVIIRNIPSDITEWTEVKQAINDTNKAKVRFISPIVEGSCYAWLAKTTDIAELLKEDILIKENKIEIELINEEEDYKKLLSGMSLGTLNSRSKDLQRIKSSAMATPIEIDDFVIRNFGCIKQMLNTLLSESEVGTKIPLSSQAGKLLAFILEYHPHSKEKKGGETRTLEGFEVGKSSNKDCPNKKCFCVVTKSKEGEELVSEDLSISKCLEGLKQVVHTFKRSEKTDFIKTLTI